MNAPRSTLWRPLPSTPRGERFRTLLLVLGVASVVVLTLGVQALVRALLDYGVMADPVHLPRIAVAVLQVVGAALLGWVSYRGRRDRLAPSDTLIALAVAPGLVALAISLLR